MDELRIPTTGRYFTMRSWLNDLVVSVATDGTKVITQLHNNTWPANQLWFEDHVTGSIRSKLNGYCLDTNRFPLKASPYNKSSGQNLVVNGATVARREDLSQVIDIAKGNKAEGAEMCIYQWKAQKNQHWTFEYGPPQYFTISAMYSGALLTACESTSGSGVCLRPAIGKAGEDSHWYEDHFGIIHARLNNFAFDSTEGDVCLRPYDPCRLHQQYAVSGNYLTNRYDPQRLLKLVLDPTGGVTVQSGPPENQDLERWFIKPVLR